MEENNNAIAQMLKEENRSQLKAFISIIWYQVFTIIRDYFVENDGQVFSKLRRQSFTKATAGLHAYIISKDFSIFVSVVFGCKEPTSFQRTIAVDLSFSIYWTFLRRLESMIEQDDQDEQIILNVEEMSVVGRSKVRHVGGWAVRKVVTRYRSYVHTNMFSVNSSTMSNVFQKQQMCELLDDHIIIPFAKLEHDTRYPETLEVIESRQFRERELLHIPDEAYLFFLTLEGKRVNLLNLQRLKKEKENMVEIAMDILVKDELVKNTWRKCFHTIPTINEVYIMHIIQVKF